MKGSGAIHIQPKLSREALIELSQAETADRLREAAAGLGHTFTVEEAKVAFAALYPLRDGGINDDALEAVCGGRAHAPVPLSDDETKQATGGAVGANYGDLLNRPTTSVSTPESEHPTFPQKPPAVLR